MELVEVTANCFVKSAHYRVALRCDRIYADSIPGQFVMLRIPDQPAPLLRRPFSIHRMAPEKHGKTEIEILYKVVGQFTAELSKLTRGDCLDMLGPLGRGFQIPRSLKNTYLVSGGIGVAPLTFLAESAACPGNGSDSAKRPQIERDPERDSQLGKCSVFLGGRSESDLLCIDDFMLAGCDLHLSTEDGSRGTKGLVTELMAASFEASRPDIIYACGPMGMLKAIAKLAAAHGIPCQVSMETLMACGIGACLGCAVENGHQKNRFLHVCMDGPVMDAAVLINE